VLNCRLSIKNHPMEELLRKGQQLYFLVVQTLTGFSVCGDLQVGKTKFWSFFSKMTNRCCFRWQQTVCHSAGVQYSKCVLWWPGMKSMCISFFHKIWEKVIFENSYFPPIESFAARDGKLVWGRASKCSSRQERPNFFSKDLR